MPALVGLDPARGADYPHQFSDGMRQRVVITIALADEPAVVIADEPTSGLDVFVQADLLDLLDDLRRRLDFALLIVSHDLSMSYARCAVSRCCTSRTIWPSHSAGATGWVVLHAGQVVEHGPTDVLLSRPEHPYTAALVEAARALSVPRRGHDRRRTYSRGGGDMTADVLTPAEAAI